ncbi:MAG: TIGR03546 family protein, partial [Planctomycetes bacterium]|nr:TIGR03546 family protein [Planctomycetota bacterium]
GVLFGLLLGFCPIDTLIWPFLILLVLVLRVNISMTLVFCAFGKMVNIFLGSVTLITGEEILNNPSLIPLWQKMYNIPIIAICGFDRVAVMGGLAIGLILGVLFFPLTLKLKSIFNQHVTPWLNKLWIVKVLKGSKLYTWYAKVIG